MYTPSAGPHLTFAPVIKHAIICNNASYVPHTISISVPTPHARALTATMNAAIPPPHTRERESLKIRHAKKTWTTAEMSPHMIVAENHVLWNASIESTLP